MHNTWCVRKRTTMNTDCLFNIAQFAGLKTATVMNRDFSKKMCPSSVTIVGYKQLNDFYNWVSCFDTTNLNEVRIVINYSAYIEHLHSLGDPFKIGYVPESPIKEVPIGLVPPSVKKLSLCIGYYKGQIQISNTVDEVLVESLVESYHGFNLQLPDSVRSLHLMDGFNDIIPYWPLHLERLCINGWRRGNGQVPISLELPDTVKHLIIGSHLDIEIWRWPENIETLMFDGDPNDYGWNLDEAMVPEGVMVTINEDAWNGVWGDLGFMEDA